MKRRVVLSGCYAIFMSLSISIVTPAYAQMQWLSQLRQSASAVVSKINAGLSGLLEQSGKRADSLAAQSYQKMDQWIDANWKLMEQAVPLIQKELRKQPLAPYEVQIIENFKKNAVQIAATMVALATLALKEVAVQKTEATGSWFARARQKLATGWQSAAELFKGGIAGWRESLVRAKNVTLSLLTQSSARIAQWLGNEWKLVSQGVPLLKKKLKKQSLTPEEERTLVAFRNRAVGVVVITVALAVAAASTYYLKKSDEPAPITEKVSAQEVAVPGQVQEAKQRELEKMTQELEQLSQEGRQQAEERQEQVRRSIEKSQEIEKWFEEQELPPSPPVRGREKDDSLVERRLPTAIELQEQRARLKKPVRPQIEVPQVEKTAEEEIKAKLGELVKEQAPQVEMRDPEVVAMEKRKLPEDLETVRQNVKTEFEQTVKSSQDKREYKKKLSGIIRDADKRLEKEVDRQVKAEARRKLEELQKTRTADIAELETKKEDKEDELDKLRRDRDAKKIDTRSYQLTSRPIITRISVLEGEIDELKDPTGLKSKAKEHAEKMRDYFSKKLREEGDY